MIMPQQGQLDWNWSWSAATSDADAEASWMSYAPATSSANALSAGIAPVSGAAVAAASGMMIGSNTRGTMNGAMNSAGASTSLSIARHSSSPEKVDRQIKYDMQANDDEAEIHTLLKEASAKTLQLSDRTASVAPALEESEEQYFAFSRGNDYASSFLTGVSPPDDVHSSSFMTPGPNTTPLNPVGQQIDQYSPYRQYGQQDSSRISDHSPWSVNNSSQEGDSTLFSKMSERFGGLSLQVDKEEESLIGTSILANTPPSQSRFIRTQEASYDPGVSQHNARYPDHVHAYPDQYVAAGRGGSIPPNGYGNVDYYEPERHGYAPSAMDPAYGYYPHHAHANPDYQAPSGYPRHGPHSDPRSNYMHPPPMGEMDRSRMNQNPYYYTNTGIPANHQNVSYKRPGYTPNDGYIQRNTYQEIYVPYSGAPIPPHHMAYPHPMYAANGNMMADPDHLGFQRGMPNQQDRNRKLGNRPNMNLQKIYQPQLPPTQKLMPTPKQQVITPKPPTAIDQTPGNISSMCKDQHGCRYLQKQLELGQANIIDAIFNEVYENAVELMIDPFGNYLCQKLLEHCTAEQRSLMIARVSGNLVQISLNMHGTRAVQKIVDMSTTPPLVHYVIDSLKDSVVALIKDLNGNHVIQRCLQRFAPEFNQFIYDSVAEHCVEVSTHRHGCCVFQRCIDHANENQRMQLVKEVVTNAIVLIQDPFGNYVVQYIADLKIASVNTTLCNAFLEKIYELSIQKFSSNVIEKCLRLANPESRTAVIRELARPEGILTLLQDAFANYVIQTAVSVADKDEYNILALAIQPHLTILRSTPFGKRILNKLRDSPHAAQGPLLAEM